MRPSEDLARRHPSHDGLLIRRGVIQDAAALARLHATSLPEGFLPSLGPRFLRHVYHALVGAEGAVVLVADDGGAVAGFAAGALDTAAFFRRFYRRRGLCAVLAALPRLVRPAVVRRALETARYGKGMPSLPHAELLSIAVAPDRRAKGLGRALGEGVVRELSRMGAPEVMVVVGAANVPANALYAGLGFARHVEIAAHAGVRSNVWVIECQSF
jgi:ribosomal protein S18 acetylase RimI-like enzyme